MNLIPKKVFYYKSPLSAYENIDKLNSIIEPKKKVRLFDILKNNKIKPYEGKIIGNNFIINRILIYYRNSWNPIINGSIKNDINGSIIDIEMKLNKFTYIFTVLWLSGTVFFGGGNLIIQLITQNIEFMLLIMPIIMFVFGVLVTKIFFEIEYKKSKIYFQNLFEAEIIVDNSKKEELKMPMNNKSKFKLILFIIPNIIISFILFFYIYIANLSTVAFFIVLLIFIICIISIIILIIKFKKMYYLIILIIPIIFFIFALFSINIKIILKYELVKSKTKLELVINKNKKHSNIIYYENLCIFPIIKTESRWLVYAYDNSGYFDSIEKDEKGKFINTDIEIMNFNILTVRRVEPFWYLFDLRK